ncbi:fimbrial protein [Pantoea ananatis]|uniref:fimbrial protein n=1 Tax=Pantoea ananas TaxID=553 RepID=UPI003C13223A
MYINSNLAKFCLLNGVICFTACNASAASNSAILNVTATVVDNTCTPGWPAAGVPVQLGRASLKDFDGAGAVGASKPFELDLKDCGSGSTYVTVTANGTPDTNNQSLFANGSSAGATGVGLGLYGGNDQTTSLLPNGSNSVKYTVMDSKVSMGFIAKLIQSNATKPTSGEFTSIVTLNVAYD